MIGFLVIGLKFYLSTSLYTGLTRGSFSMTFYLFSLTWSQNNVYILDDENNKTNISTIFGNLLDESLRQLPIEPEGFYMDIHRFPETNWKLTCNVGDANIKCLVYAKKLILLISQTIKAGEIFSDILPSAAWFISWSKSAKLDKITETNCLI